MPKGCFSSCYNNNSWTKKGTQLGAFFWFISSLAYFDVLLGYLLSIERELHTQDAVG